MDEISTVYHDVCKEVFVKNCEVPITFVSFIFNSFILYRCLPKVMKANGPSFVLSLKIYTCIAATQSPPSQLYMYIHWYMTIFHVYMSILVVYFTMFFNTVSYSKSIQISFVVLSRLFLTPCVHFSLTGPLNYHLKDQSMYANIYMYII